MIHTTSYLFSDLSPDSQTFYITPCSPPAKRDASEPIPIEISNLVYFVQHPSSSRLTGYYLGKNSDSSYTAFTFTLDEDSPKLPEELERFIVKNDSTRKGGKKRRIDVVVNRKSGHGYSTGLLNDVVLPLLKPFEEFGLIEGVKVWETEGENDGERIGRELVRDHEGDKTVIVLGGDGTVHEVLNGAVSLDSKEKNSSLDLVLIPTGTANAMYYHLFPPESPLYPTSTPLSPFYSLLSFLRQSSSPHPLPLALNTIDRPSSSSPSSSASPSTSPLLTSVVTSAALHACLLHDAEALRSTHPGVERFKIAAQENVKLWWNGSLILRGGTLKRYDPFTQSFQQETEEEVVLKGPFAYWVSSLVSRFEPNFIVAPFRSPQHSLAPSIASDDLDSIDLVVVRPLRHGPTKEAFERGEEGLGEKFAERVWKVTGGMYEGGKHTEMSYPKGEGVDDEEGEGEEGEDGKTTIVEVWRVKEYVWTPDPSSDLKQNLVCFDGALHDLERGGSLKTKVLDTEQTRVRVWR